MSLFFSNKFNFIPNIDNILYISNFFDCSKRALYSKDSLLINQRESDSLLHIIKANKKWEAMSLFIESLLSQLNSFGILLYISFINFFCESDSTSFKSLYLKITTRIKFSKSINKSSPTLS